MRTIGKEFDQPVQDDVMAEFFDEESLIQWYIGVRAVERFNTQQGHYPGEKEEQLEVSVKLTFLGGPKGS